MPILTKTKEKIALRELSKVVEIPCELIAPNPDQPRKSFDADELEKLAKSISQDGVIQPLIVGRAEDGFRLISGERRLRAAKLAGFKCVPCVVVNISDERSRVVSLIENIQRADLNVFEEAEAISMLINSCGLTQEECALRLGLSQSAVANKLRILRLNENERKLILDNALTERHARAILKLDEPKRLRMLKRIASQGLTVKQTEKLVADEISAGRVKKSYERRAPILGDLRLFFNSVDKAVEVVRLAGIDCKVKKNRTDGFIEYVIRVKS